MAFSISCTSTLALVRNAESPVGTDSTGCIGSPISPSGCTVASVPTSNTVLVLLAPHTETEEQEKDNRCLHLISDTGLYYSVSFLAITSRYSIRLRVGVQLPQQLVTMATALSVMTLTQKVPL